MLDLSQCPYLESDPEMLGGAWVLKGTRMPLFAILDNICDGGIENVLDLFPGVEKDDVEEVFEWLVKNTKPDGWI